MYKIENYFIKILGILIFALFSGVLIFTVLQVFFRYVLGNPLIWSEELARYLFIWGVLLGSVLALQKKLHIGIEVLLDKIINKKVKTAVEILIDLLIIIFSIYIIYYGFSMVLKLTNTKSAALKIPLATIYSAVPVAAVFWLLITVVKTINRFKIRYVHNQAGSEKSGRETSC